MRPLTHPHAVDMADCDQGSIAKSSACTEQGIPQRLDPTLLSSRWLLAAVWQPDTLLQVHQARRELVIRNMKHILFDYLKNKSFNTT